MKIGIELPHYGNDVSVDRVVEIATECERIGFDSVWISDHLAFDYERYGRDPGMIGCLEAMTTLAVLASVTDRVRIGTLVICNEFRHPLVLAKEAVTVDLASNGRLDLGLGAGWYEREFVQSGIDFPRPAVRLARLAEAIEILKLAFTGEPVRFEGKHYLVDGLAALPRPIQSPRPPIWVGAKGPRAIAIAARADGWNAAHIQDPADYEPLTRHLDGAPVRRSIAQYAKGSAPEIVDRLSGFAALGVEEAIMSFSDVPFGLDDPDDIARFAQDVLPYVRDL